MPAIRWNDKLPREIFDACPRDRSRLLLGLLHGLDLAMRLPAHELQLPFELGRDGCVCISVYPDSRAIESVEIIKMRMGWSRRRVIAVALHVALTDTHSPIGNVSYLTRHRDSSGLRRVS